MTGGLQRRRRGELISLREQFRNDPHMRLAAGLCVRILLQNQGLRPEELAPILGYTEHYLTNMLSHPRLSEDMAQRLAYVTHTDIGFWQGQRSYAELQGVKFDKTRRGIETPGVLLYPGLCLRVLMERQQLTEAQLSAILGFSPEQVHRLGERNVSGNTHPDAFRCVAKVTGTSEAFWQKGHTYQELEGITIDVTQRAHVDKAERTTMTAPQPPAFFARRVNDQRAYRPDGRGRGGEGAPLLVPPKP